MILEAPKKNSLHPVSSSLSDLGDRCEASRAKSDRLLALVARRIQWHRKLRDIAALKFADLADALLVDLIDTDDGVHW